MEEPWAQVFLKNGQFQTTNKKNRNKRDHVYQYLVSKYKGLFDAPITPKRLTKPKSSSTIKTKSSTLRNQSFHFDRRRSVKENRSCPRCVMKSPVYSMEHTKADPMQPRKHQSSKIFPKRRISKLLGSQDVTSIELENSRRPKPANLSTYSKQVGFIKRKASDTPIEGLLSSERGLRY